MPVPTGDDIRSEYGDSVYEELQTMGGVVDTMLTLYELGEPSVRTSRLLLYAAYALGRMQEAADEKDELPKFAKSLVDENCVMTLVLVVGMGAEWRIIQQVGTALAAIVFTVEGGANVVADAVRKVQTMHEENKTEPSIFEILRRLKNEHPHVYSWPSLLLGYGWPEVYGSEVEMFERTASEASEANYLEYKKQNRMMEAIGLIMSNAMRGTDEAEEEEEDEADDDEAPAGRYDEAIALCVRVITADAIDYETRQELHRVVRELGIERSDCKE